MKPVIRYQSQLLPRRSYKPSRVIRIRPVKLRFDFQPVRFGIKPKITIIDQAGSESSAVALAGAAPQSTGLCTGSRPSSGPCHDHLE
jgi:hypothetical protein